MRIHYKYLWAEDKSFFLSPSVSPVQYLVYSPHATSPHLQTILSSFYLKTWAMTPLVTLYFSFICHHHSYFYLNLFPTPVSYQTCITMPASGSPGDRCQSLLSSTSLSFTATCDNIFSSSLACVCFSYPLTCPRLSWFLLVLHLCTVSRSALLHLQH